MSVECDVGLGASSVVNNEDFMQSAENSAKKREERDSGVLKLCVKMRYVLIAVAVLTARILTFVCKLAEVPTNMSMGHYLQI